jgi:SOS-response transcriptional repressor LexA
MPHALTERQKECLDYIRGYIAENESSPRLEEIASYLGVKSPTAHKLLEALQSKGYLYFGRDKVSGFFVRLIDRAGSAETMVEIALAGKIDGYGEVFDFPQELGHFASVLIGSKPDEVFALVVMEDIPQASMLASDFIIFDWGKKPQPGDICIAPIGDRFFLVQVTSSSFEDTPSLVAAQYYPIPEKLARPDPDLVLNWYPLAHNEATHDYFIQVAEVQRWQIGPLDPKLVVATAMRLIRALAF